MIHLIFILLSLFSTLFLPQFFPYTFSLLPLPFFVPYLVYVLLEKSLFFALVQAVIAGIVVDLSQSTAVFGITALCFVLTTLLVSRKRHLFFIHHTWALPLMTLFYTLLLQLTIRAVHLIASLPLALGISFMVEWIFVPLLTALFSLVGFALPLHLYKRREMKKRELAAES